MKGKKVIKLSGYKDLEDYLVKVDGRLHKFFAHNTVSEIYIIDFRPYRPKKENKQMGLFEYRNKSH